MLAHNLTYGVKIKIGIKQGKITELSTWMALCITYELQIERIDYGHTHFFSHFAL
jgi:hypothetical protein